VVTLKSVHSCCWKVIKGRWCPAGIK